MSLFDMNSNAQAISPGDLSMLAATLDVWCSEHRILRRDASHQAKILLESYNKGKRSQVDLIDALARATH